MCGLDRSDTAPALLDGCPGGLDAFGQLIGEVRPPLVRGQLARDVVALDASHGGICAAVWSLRLSDCTAHQRADLINHHGSVAALLRQRGHRIRAGIVHRNGGEFLTLRIVTGPDGRVLA